MPSQRNKFLNKDLKNTIKFPSYEPNTPFISLADYNQQLNLPVTAKILPKVSENITHGKPQNAVTSQLFPNATQPNTGDRNADEAKKSTLKTSKLTQQTNRMRLEKIFTCNK